MKTLSEAFEALKIVGYRPLLGLGGAPAAGLTAGGRRIEASTYEQLQVVLEAYSILVAEGWIVDRQPDAYPWFPTLYAPLNREHERFFKQDGK